MKKINIIWKALLANLLVVPAVAFGIFLLFDLKPIPAAGFLPGVVF